MTPKLYLFLFFALLFAFCRTAPADGRNERKWMLTEEEDMSVLQNVSQEPIVRKTSNTQWSVVYNLTKGTYRLCVGRKYETTVMGTYIQ